VDLARLGARLLHILKQDLNPVVEAFPALGLTPRLGSSPLFFTSLIPNRYKAALSSLIEKIRMRPIETLDVNDSHQHTSTILVKFGVPRDCLTALRWGHLRVEAHYARLLDVLSLLDETDFGSRS
jgi:hypothetical protein